MQKYSPPYLRNLSASRKLRVQRSDGIFSSQWREKMVSDNLSRGKYLSKLEPTGKRSKVNIQKAQAVIRIYYLYNLLAIINLVALCCLTVKTECRKSPRRNSKPSLHVNEV